MVNLIVVHLRGHTYCIFVVVDVVSLGGVRLSPLGTSATNWPTVSAPDDR
jgi:hypothetical protein